VDATVASEVQTLRLRKQKRKENLRRLQTLRLQQQQQRPKIMKSSPVPMPMTSKSCPELPELQELNPQEFFVQQHKQQQVQQQQPQPQQQQPQLDLNLKYCIVNFTKHQILAPAECTEQQEREIQNARHIQTEHLSFEEAKQISSVQSWCPMTQVQAGKVTIRSSMKCRNLIYQLQFRPWCVYFPHEMDWFQVLNFTEWDATDLICGFDPSDYCNETMFRFNSKMDLEGWLPSNCRLRSDYLEPKNSIQEVEELIRETFVDFVPIPTGKQRFLKETYVIPRKCTIRPRRQRRSKSTAIVIGCNDDEDDGLDASRNTLVMVSSAMPPSKNKKKKKKRWSLKHPFMIRRRSRSHSIVLRFPPKE
jgi:hypothetical protein